MRDDGWRDFVHTGPGTLAGSYLRMFWQPVARSQDLAPGQAIPIRIMSEDFTLYRGQVPQSDGALPNPPAPDQRGRAHLVAFRCAHRGTQLNVGWVEGDCI